MINLTYHLARSIEFVSCAIGVGEFMSTEETEFLCSTCASPPSSSTTTTVSSAETYNPPTLFFLSDSDFSPNGENELCSTCQSAYLRRLCSSPSPFSAGFTRRLNVSLGVSCLVLGFLAAVGNASEGWWAQGGVVESAMKYLSTFVPAALNTEAVRVVLIYVLTTIYLLALTTLLCNILLATFVLALSPLSRAVGESEAVGEHEGEGEGECESNSMMWVIYLTQGCFAMALLATVYTLGVFASTEAVFVWFPVVMGILAVGCAAFCGGKVEKERLTVGEKGGFVGDVKVKVGMRVEDMV